MNNILSQSINQNATYNEFNQQTLFYAILHIIMDTQYKHIFAMCDISKQFFQKFIQKSVIPTSTDFNDMIKIDKSEQLQTNSCIQMANNFKQIVAYRSLFRPDKSHQNT